MSDQDFLRLLTAAVRVAKPFHGDTITIADLDVPFSDYNVDSLDMLMVGIYMSETFGIPEEIAKEMKSINPREMRDFLLKHATIRVTDIDAAIEGMK
jgi:hypothetical protein